MKLQKIYLKNWLSYREAKLDFRDTKLCVLVGENGSGKSSILEAITYAFFGVARTTDSRGAGIDQLIYLDASELSVRVNWEMNGHLYSLKRKRIRDQGTYLDLEIDGSVYEGKIAEVQAMIIEIIGVTLDVWNVTMNAMQERVSLLSCKNTQRKELLMSLFELREYNTFEEQTKEQISSVKQEKSLLEETLEFLDKDLDRLKEITEESCLEIDKEIDKESAEKNKLEIFLKNSENQLQEREDCRRELEQAKKVQRHFFELVSSGEDKLVKVENKLNEISSFLSAKKEKLEEKEGVVTSISSLKKRQDELTKELAISIEEHREQVRNVESLKSILRVKKERLSKLLDLKQLKDCEYCEQEIDIELAHDKLEKLKEVVSDEALILDRELSLENKILENFSKQEAELLSVKQSLERKLAEEQRIASYLDKCSYLESEQAELKQTREDLDSEIQKNKEAEHEQQTRARVLLERLQNYETDKTQSEFEELIKSYSNKLEKLQQKKLEHLFSLKEKERLKLEKTKIQASLVALVSRQERLVKLKFAFSRDGIPLKMIEQTLPVLEARTNTILEKLDSTLRIRLSTVKLLKSGKQASTLDIIVIDSAGTERVVELCSGGEKLRIDLALRVSCCEFLSSSSQLQTLLLDEYFAPLDESGQERIMGILEHVLGVLDLRVLFVTHSRQVQEYAGARYLVEKKNSESTVLRG